MPKWVGKMICSCGGSIEWDAALNAKEAWIIEWWEKGHSRHPHKVTVLNPNPTTEQERSLRRLRGQAKRSEQR